MAKLQTSRVLNFFQFFPPSPPLLALSEAETTFNELSNAKSLQNICCNRCSQSKDYSSFGRSAIASTFALSLSLEYWKVGEEESCSGLRVVGGITNRFFPSFFSFFLFLQSRHVFQIKEGDVGKKQMYLSRAAPRAEDEGTLPVLSSNHVPTIVSPTTPNHSSHSLDTQQN